MIGKVSRGRNAGGLLRYLFGPGRFNEHTTPHLIASWAGDDAEVLAALEPSPLTNGRPDVTTLAGRLTVALQLQPDVDRPIWHASLRTAPSDRRLTDADWAAIARDVVDRTGFAPVGDPAACRWVAVRHADDHIHIAVVLARVDGHPVNTYRDWPKVHAAARAAEQRHGLSRIADPGHPRVTRTPTRGEVEKATRTGQVVTARAWLTRQVRMASRTATNVYLFSEQLQRRGVLVTWRHSRLNPGEVTGYAVGRPGDLDGTGRQVWFGGSKLAPDLSLPRLTTHWNSAPLPRRRHTPRTIDGSRDDVSTTRRWVPPASRTGIGVRDVADLVTSSGLPPSAARDLAHAIAALYDLKQALNSRPARPTPPISRRSGPQR